MAMERAALDTAKGRPINPADLPTPENVKSYITNCLKRYQQAHNLPEDSVKVSDANCTPAPKGPRTTGDLYHIHSCGLSNPNCKKLQDYQTQIMLLEHQNRRRLMMARGETEPANVATKQPITSPSYQEIKFRHYKLQDYQRQLMREGQHAPKEQEVPSTCVRRLADGQSKSELQDPFNEEGMKNLSLEEYQKQLTYLRCGNSKNMSKPHPEASECPSSVTNEQRLQSQGALRKQQEWTGTFPGIIPTPAGASIDASSQPPDASHLKDRAASRQRRSSIQDYEMQLMLLEQQNKKRLMMARNEQDKVVADGAPKAQDSEQKLEPPCPREAQLSAQVQTPNYRLQDYQMQLMLLEQQRRKLLMSKKNGQQKPPVSAPSYDQESEQILEMGSVLRSQKTVQYKNDLPALMPATTPLLVRQDANGVRWIAFEFENERGGVKMEYTIRCDVNSVNCDELSLGFKSENCVFPGACDRVEGYKADETECINLGWALADLNPVLRNKRTLLRQAVDWYRKSIEKVVPPPREDEEDIAMWSTDEFDEWSNCGDDMETVEKDEV